LMECGIMQQSFRGFIENILASFHRARSDESGVAEILEHAKDEIRSIRAGLDTATDSVALDMYIYRLKNAEDEYRRLLKMAREAQRKKTG